MKILISGASIAGPAAAWELCRQGHEVTVVERASTLRRGGYAVDIRGAALDVIVRMGFREQLRAFETDTESNSMVDDDGRRFGTMARGFGVIDANDVEILRGDLAGVLFDATRDHADYRFGETIYALQQHDDGIDVTFASSRRERFDVVIGADGVHSRVRALAFGPESSFLHDLGSAMAIGTIPNVLGLTREQLSFNDVKRIATVKSTNHDRDLTMCVFYPMARGAFDPEDEVLQRRQVEDAFRASGWELPRLVDAMARADDFYSDLTCQIRMKQHHVGRVVLIGDAGYCPSPLAGQGTSLALVGAHLLAHSLQVHTDPSAALAHHDAAMTPFVIKNQDLARRIGGGFTPGSAFELGVRNAAMRMLPYLPGASAIMSFAMRSVGTAARAISSRPLLREVL